MLGSLRILRRLDGRVELAVTRITTLVGAITLATGALAALALLPLAPKLSAIAAGIAAVGALFLSLRRRVVLDRAEGVIQIEQRLAGLGSRRAVPLIHVRAIVVARRGAGFALWLDRRVGAPIELDDGPTAAPLRRLARALADAGELRLVDDDAA